MTKYQEFIHRKEFIDHHHSGIDLPEHLISDRLFPFQKQIVLWALRKGRSAVWADCGTGKSLVALEWAKHIFEANQKPILLLAPLAVTYQFLSEAAKFGFDKNKIKVVKHSSEVIQGLNITNYEKLHHFDDVEFHAVVLDECFAPGTPIRVCRNNVWMTVPIESVQVGETIINASGIDTVSSVHRREVQYAIKIKFAEQEIISSPNHPWFTQRGWVGSQDLQPGDSLVTYPKAMQLVQSGICSEISTIQKGSTSEILREILLSEMENAPTGNTRESSQPCSREKTWGEQISMVQIRIASSRERERANEESQSMLRSSNQSETISNIESDRPRTFRAWGQWSRDDITSAVDEGCSWQELDCGIQYLTGATTSRISNTLQTRLSMAREKNRNRSGWAHSSIQERSGQEKGSEAGFVRVDSIEVLELGHPELDRFKSTDGKLYFYDLEAKQHPSFTVGEPAVIVHNSSILKAYTSKTRNLVIERFNTTPFKLCCTATPAPNDHMELGNHAEFLGVMSRIEMLSMFFVHDGGETQKWRLKGHAEEDYWKWLCSWAVFIRKPSDIGFDDTGFDLPPMHQHIHVVKSAFKREETDQLALFHVDEQASTLLEQRQARRGSLKDRVKLAADLVNADKDYWLVWCDLNIESHALASAIPGAVEVQGSDSPEKKERELIRFSQGETRVMVTKASIAGWGLNLQHCHNAVFVGVSHSFEQWYQAIRRIYRFGQEKEVNCHVVISNSERHVIDNLMRKKKDVDRMSAGMVQHMSELMRINLSKTTRITENYNPNQKMQVPSWLVSQ